MSPASSTAHQVPLLLRSLEHQHRRRPVRPAGPQGDGVRPQAQGLQGARLRRRPVPRRRHRPGRPRLAEHRSRGSPTVKKILDGEGLFVEIIAPRLWEDPRTIDGAFTSNNPADRKYALDRSRRCVDIAREVGCKNYVLWLAREGTYIREAKDAKTAVGRIVDAWNAILEHDKEIRILGEAKPNEPMDQAYLPTVGHMIGVAYKTIDPSRSGVLIESAHSILAGLDPADDMAYALYHDKLWSVHLNDQNGLKYDQDKVFGSVDLRRAFNQVWILEKNGYGRNGECVGLDVKAMRTTTFEESMYHLAHSKTMFLRLLDDRPRASTTRRSRSSGPSASTSSSRC